MWYHCDDKYSPWHKWKEPKLFQIDATNNNSVDEAPSLEVHKEEVGETQTDPDNDLTATTDEPIISLHALAGISLPQILKFRSFIKHRPVVVLIDNGSTHNFMHKGVV